MIYRIKLALFATALAGCLILSAVQAFAQALPVCNWGDMIYKASTNYACLPYDNTAGKFLQGQGASAQPIWTFQAATGFLLPTQSTNTFLGNTTGGNASPTPNTVSQILDTIGYDVSRPPTPGSLLYKTNVAPNNAWQALAPPALSGLVLSYAGGAPVWATNVPSLDGFCATQGAILFRNATVWNCLAPANIVNQFLNSGGPGQDVAWTTVTAASLGAVPTSRLVSTGTGLSGGGDLSADRTLSIASTISAAGPIGTATAAPVITFNAQGQLTAVSSATITPAFSSLTGQATLAQLPTLGANSILGAATAGVPVQLAAPSCSGATNALQWVTNTGFQCGSLASGGTLTGPVSSTNTAIPRWNGTTGLVLSDSGVTLDGSSNMAGVNSIAGAVIASKAVQQTGTSAVTVVTPSQAQSHDSAAKAWAYCTNSTGTYTLQASYNIQGGTCGKTGTGDLTFTMTTGFSSAQFSCVASVSALFPEIATVTTVSATQFRVQLYNLSGTLINDNFSVHCFGRQ